MIQLPGIGRIGGSRRWFTRLSASMSLQSTAHFENQITGKTDPRWSMLLPANFRI